VETSGELNQKDPTMSSDLPACAARQGKSWNLILLVPLLVLATPLYNRDAPRLGGFPMFYWVPVLFIPLSVICVALVCQKTTETDPGGSETLPGAQR